MKLSLNDVYHKFVCLCVCVHARVCTMPLLTVLASCGVIDKGPAIVWKYTACEFTSDIVSNGNLNATDDASCNTIKITFKENRKHLFLLGKIQGIFCLIELHTSFIMTYIYKEAKKYFTTKYHLYHKMLVYL